jgi:hypothetical protein
MNPPSEAIKNDGALGLLGFKMEEGVFTMDLDHHAPFSFDSPA